METSFYYFINLLQDDTYITKPFYSSLIWVTLWNLILLMPCSWSQYLVFREKKLSLGQGKVLNSNSFWQGNLYAHALAFSTGALLSRWPLSPSAAFQMCSTAGWQHVSCEVPINCFCFLGKYYLFTSVFKVVKEENTFFSRAYMRYSALCLSLADVITHSFFFLNNWHELPSNTLFLIMPQRGIIGTNLKLFYIKW